MIRTTISLFALLGSLALGNLASAAEGEQCQHHYGPHPEAIAACAGLSDGAPCSVTFNEKTHAGTCMKRHEDRPLACRPDDMPHHGHHHEEQPAQ